MARLQEDPRVLRTKKLIIDSFISLMKEKAFHSISIKDITEQATINRATFYRHFSDKHLLLENVVQEIMMKQAFEKVRQQQQLNEQSMQMIIDSFCDFVEELQQTFGRNYDTVIHLAENTFKHELIDLFLHFFPTENEKDKIKVRYIAIMLVTSIYSASCAWISEGKNMSREAFSETIIGFLMGAIRNV